MPAGLPGRVLTGPQPSWMLAVRDVKPLVTARFARAIERAQELHGADVRKGTAVPYMAHLLGVCALVLRDNGSEDEAVAALLHDALEDHPEAIGAKEIEEEFGPRVRAIVEACTDTPADYAGGPKPSWRQRKARYIEHVCSAAPGDLRVAVADKLDNARSIVADLRELGDAIWSRFNAGKADQLWYYRALVQAFDRAGARGQLFFELEAAVSELERLAR